MDTNVFTRRMRALGPLVLVLLLLLPQPGSATHQTPLDVNAQDLNVLVYHPLPDHQGDPWGVEAFDFNGTAVDWMAGFYAAYDFPTAVFDGVTALEGLPTNEGAGAFQDTYDAYRRVLDDRISKDAPVSIRLDAVLHGETADAEVTVRWTGLDAGSGLTLRLVLFEDDVGFAGGNGIVNHRFVVRSLSPNIAVNLSDDGFSTTARLAFPSSTDRDHVGVAAIVQNLDEGSTRYKPKEVLNSAVWVAAQDGPTVQVVRGVLLEMYSATWCASCVYGDSATDALADEFGIQSSTVSQGGFEYLRPADWLRVAAAIVVGVGFAVWIGRRPRQEGSA